MTMEKEKPSENAQDITPLDDCYCVFLLVPIPEIVYVANNMESYENLLVVTTLDREKGLVCVHGDPDNREEIDAVVAAFVEECDLKVIAQPENLVWPDYRR